MSLSEAPVSNQRSPSPGSREARPPLQRIQSNRMMLDLRQQVQWQNKIIRDLKAERDRLTKELASRLFFVEAQLRREQKHIESLLNEKDQYIRFQNIQIESLKCILAQVDQDYKNQQQECAAQRNRAGTVGPSGRRTKMPAPPLSQRYSVALNEYMRNNVIVSALPVLVQNDQETDKKGHPQEATESQSGCTRTLSMPELRLNQATGYIGPDQCYAPYTSYVSGQSLTQDLIDELATRRWTSDCDSEHSDSLDSGISSPSIASRSLHLDDADRRIKDDSDSSRRGLSIGNFLNKKFSFSSNHLEKLKNEPAESAGRRHSNSFSETKPKEEVQKSSEVIPAEQKPRKFISSANRTFGTNHRSVTKPRDIKFRKLFKFRRREQTDAEAVNGDDYMTV